MTSLRFSVNQGRYNAVCTINTMQIRHSAEVQLKTDAGDVRLMASTDDMLAFLREAIARIEGETGASHPPALAPEDSENFFNLPFNHPIRRAFVGQANIAQMVEVLQSNQHTAALVDDLPKWMKQEAGILPRKQKRPQNSHSESVSPVGTSPNVMGTLSNINPSPLKVKDIERMSQLAMFEDEAA